MKKLLFNDPALAKTNFVMIHDGWPFAKEATAMDERKLAENQGQFHVNWVLPMTPLDGEMFKLAYLGESQIGEKIVFGIGVK